MDEGNTSHQCPSALNLLSRSSLPRSVCDITSNGCFSITFTVHGVKYSHVYGRIIAYQNRVPIAFYYINFDYNNHIYDEIDEPYVYGVSLTHGQSPRKHVWTFAGASDETSSNPTFKCPCINTNISLFQASLAITTSVILPSAHIMAMWLEHSNLVTPSGMKQDVVPLIPAVPSIIHHGLPSTFPHPLPMV